MTSDPVGPLSRPFAVHRVTPEGTAEEVEASQAEREALARDLGLPAIHALVGRYRISGGARRVRVVGRIEASLDQICVVTLEPFTNSLAEDVEVEFAAPEDPRGRREEPQDTEVEADLDQPEPLVGDRIDLGAITAEFLALGLDPYPRKPGAVYAAPDAKAASESPFAQLARLKPDRTDGK